ncbi:MAG: hypothetical protein A3E37_02930 [Candidatus Andersenbacteria bacterium RIFCSPHIGHO2_12_FULL_46_9]|nr:MAG: Type III restriction enzyme, res subunit [Parcubacteria group bacterium GW2011_GWA2_45_14]OGY33002.1 MAG: hypothetical protein A3B76_01155 [Candidatus Andersenbacteria bacterium RIFCSPHIGHO2_02_FULL_46_16]OGY36552.1 MAG: hypothetical protein A3E37_02930 [Candidatus Andersenbacteria bacterium RIFCSPHIGHO2_12_FULL_46_9]OGY37155.1 MAG: hypothetical protein A3I08_02225 [Candidatus Andersenbacteria bacterium RIFCSPLOWO2_02_FULL_46_11]OGY39521.1 MAG: hypothetical protein A3G57_04370 [Candidat
MVTRNSSDKDKITLYRSYFRGRTDVYARYWRNTEGKSGYAPALDGKQRPLVLTDAVIKGHLLGIELVGVYLLLPNNTTYFLAVDFDGENWLDDALAVQNTAQKHKLPSLLERSKSGNGGHVWFFFENAIPAWKARQVGKHLIAQAQLTNSKSFDRLFPSQDEHTGKGLGNLIALPLNGKYVKEGATVFIDKAGEPLSDQWQALSSYKKIGEAALDRLLSNIKITPPKPKEERNNSEDAQSTIQTSSKPQAKLVLGNQIYIPQAFLPDKLYKFAKQNCNFTNPQYYEMQRKGYSTWKTPRRIYTIDVHDEGISLPDGFLTQLQSFANEQNIKLDIDDQRIVGKSITFRTSLKLSPEQQKVAAQLLKQDRVVLEAPPGFGKSIVALYCIKRRRQPALVIVHRKSLLHQWRKLTEQWFELEKGELGIIGDSKWNPGSKLTIASYQTLARRGVEEIADQFGFVVIDECHHTPAHTFTKVLKLLPAKYVLGLTATPIRKDKLDKLIPLYIGPITTSSSKQAEITAAEDMNKVPIRVHLPRTEFVAPDKNVTFNQLGKLLISNENRNQQIVSDVINAMRTGAKCLILTDRVAHEENLLKLIRQQMKYVHATAISGQLRKKEREKLLKRIKQPRFQLLIATGKLVGEGFDWPELNHLFLTFPISWKGRLTQYIGRVQRKAEGKEDAHVYDYVDYEVPMLRLMYFKRLRTYRELGLVRQKIRTVKQPIDVNQLSMLH